MPKKQNWLRVDRLSFGFRVFVSLSVIFALSLPLRASLALPLSLALPISVSLSLALPLPSQAEQPWTPQRARATLERARRLGREMSQKDTDELFAAAERMSYYDYIRESQEVLKLVCNSKYARAEHFCMLADSYSTTIGDIDANKVIQQHLNRAIKLDPKNSHAWNSLAEMATKDGDVKKALEYSDKAVDTGKSKPFELCHLTRAIILANLKRYKEALDCILLAEKDLPNRAEVYRVKASTLENLNRYDEAVTAYRHAYQLQKQDWTIYQIARCLDKAGKYKEAIAEVDTLIKLSPQDADAYRARSALKVKLKDINGAISDISKAIEQEPTTKSYQERARLYKQIGKNDLASKDEAAAHKIMDSPF